MGVMYTLHVSDLGNSFDEVALYFGAGLMIPGIMFMLKCKVFWKDTLKLPAFDPLREFMKTDESKIIGGMMTHLGFIVGAIAFSLGLTMLCLAMKLPPALAATPPVTGMCTVLLYMGVAQTGIVGFPGISGPPMPARIVIAVIGLVLNVNWIIIANDGHLKNDNTQMPDVWTKFIIMYIFSIAFYHGIAYKHRTDGWEVSMQLDDEAAELKMGEPGALQPAAEGEEKA